MRKLMLSAVLASLTGTLVGCGETTTTPADKGTTVTPAPVTPTPAPDATKPK